MSRPGQPWQNLQFFLTPPHPCGYFDREDSVTLLVDPTAKMTPGLYARLLEQGFRRSGNHVYRPHCPSCNGCVPVRIPAADFKMNRSLRRTWNKNQDLKVMEMQPGYRDEQFQLYEKYIVSRHRGGSMDNPTPETYADFLMSENTGCLYYEFSLKGKPVMVAVTDRIPGALSAVYTFFDPALDKRSLGNFAILWQADRARRLGLKWLYLGYWIENCRKMSYKSRFQPLEAFHSKLGWLPLPAYRLFVQESGSGSAPEEAS